jgi:hypothetical protein
MTIEVRARDDGPAFDVVDPIERRRVSFRFPSPVELGEADADGFVYPVDRAVAFRTGSIVVEDGASAAVLDAEGQTHADVSTLESVEVDAFFLNACDSHEQGQALLDGGAIVGIVTTVDVLNEPRWGLASSSPGCWTTASRSGLRCGSRPRSTASRSSTPSSATAGCR